MRLRLAKGFCDPAYESFGRRPCPPGGRDGVEWMVGPGLCPVGVAMVACAVAQPVPKALEGARESVRGEGSPPVRMWSGGGHLPPEGRRRGRRGIPQLVC